MSSTFTFGTKTSYLPPSPLQPLLPHHPFRPTAHTRLIHVSLIARHGTRNPTKSSLDRLHALHTWFRKTLPLPHPPWLDPWARQLHHYNQSPGDLTMEGEQELWHIGQRFAYNYATSLHHSGAVVRIRSSHKTRAVASARAFTEGYLQTSHDENLPLPWAFHEPDVDSDSDSDPDHTISHDSSSVSSADDDPFVEILPTGRDLILRFFERHKEYKLFINNHRLNMQCDAVRDSLFPHLKSLASRIPTALGITQPMDVQYVRVIAEACAFDYAHGRAASSPFCKAFSENDAALLERIEKRYRPFFKAHEHFRAVAAPLVEDLVASLTACVNQSPATPAYAADLRFAHAETIVPLLLLLGIQNNGLPADHPDFRAGLCGMSPFAANLAIELYESTDSSGVSYFVRFRLHERYVQRIPALGEHGRNGAVLLEHLLAFFHQVLDEGMHAYAP